MTTHHKPTEPEEPQGRSPRSCSMLVFLTTALLQERKLTHCLSEELSSLKGLWARSYLGTAGAFPILWIMVGPLMMLLSLFLELLTDPVTTLLWLSSIFLCWCDIQCSMWVEEEAKDEEGLLELSLLLIGLKGFSFLMQLVSKQGRFRPRAVWL